MNNLDIRRAITRSGLKYWQIAEAYGCTDGNFSRKLRRELLFAEKEKILEIINRLSKEVC